MIAGRWNYPVAPPIISNLCFSKSNRRLFRKDLAMNANVTAATGAIVIDSLWESIRTQTRKQAEAEPVLASFLYSTILNHDSLEAALSFHLANKLDSPALPAMLIREVIEEAMTWSAVPGNAISFFNSGTVPS